LAIFIAKLLDVEYTLRKGYLDLIDSGKKAENPIIEKEKMLPFERIFQILEEKRSLIEPYILKLRSWKKKRV